MTLMMRLFTSLNGRLVGRDAVGNIYYEAKRAPGPQLRRRRWVMYAGEVEASTIPPEWHSWLHYTTELPIPETVRRAWQKPHEPNLTGTPLGYRSARQRLSGRQAAPSHGRLRSLDAG